MRGLVQRPRRPGSSRRFRVRSRWFSLDGALAIKMSTSADLDKPSDGVSVGGGSSRLVPRLEESTRHDRIGWRPVPLPRGVPNGPQCFSKQRVTCKFNVRGVPAGSCSVPLIPGIRVVFVLRVESWLAKATAHWLHVDALRKPAGGALRKSGHLMVVQSAWLSPRMDGRVSISVLRSR